MHCSENSLCSDPHHRVSLSLSLSHASLVLLSLSFAIFFSPGPPSDTLGRRCLPYGYTRPTSTTTHARPLSRPMLLTHTQRTEFHDHSARAVGCQAPSSTQTHLLGANNVHIHIHNICITSDERDEYTQEPGPTCCPRYLPLPWALNGIQLSRESSIWRAAYVCVPRSTCIAHAYPHVPHPRPREKPLAGRESERAK